MPQKSRVAMWKRISGIKCTISKINCSPFTNWYSGRDLNPHASRHQNLNLACLPISPPEQNESMYMILTDHTVNYPLIIKSVRAADCFVLNTQSGVAGTKSRQKSVLYFVELGDALWNFYQIEN